MNREILKKLILYFERQAEQKLEPAVAYEAGKKIFTAGKRPKGIHYITGGRVKVVSEGDQDEDLIIRIVGPHDIIGYESLITGTEYTSSAVVIEKADVHFLPKSNFLQLLKNDVGFANYVLEALCIQLKKREEKISGLLGMDGKQRLAMLILSLERAYEYEEGGKVTTKITCLPRKDLAGDIGVTPETLSRYLAEFRDKGFIRLEDSTIVILNRSALLRLSKVND